MWMSEPNYNESEFKKLYRIFRQLKSPFFKGKSGDKDVWWIVFDGKTKIDETESIKNRIRGKNAKSKTESQFRDIETVDTLCQDEP